MSKQSMLTILLVSAICTLANTITGWVLADATLIASIVLSVIFLVNAKIVFGAEAESARQSCLWNAIANGAVLVLGGGVLVIFIIFTLGIGALLIPFFQGLITLMNIGFGVWQLVAWTNLRNSLQATQAQQ